MNHSCDKLPGFFHFLNDIDHGVLDRSEFWSKTSCPVIFPVEEFGGLLLPDDADLDSDKRHSIGTGLYCELHDRVSFLDRGERAEARWCRIQESVLW